MNQQSEFENMVPAASAADPQETARRSEAREQLAKRLQDPDFRAKEGFPFGSSDDILAMSDPPFYTACPNPFLEEVINEWQEERQRTRKQMELGDEYKRDPFSADVSEGKTDRFYNAHSYHTKVPHKAIMRYILHYTDPGDLVLDGFSGTGMTGIAAQLCGDRATIESLGYRVDANDVVYDGSQPITSIGARRAVLNDLSPVATYISYNYNTPVDVEAFKKAAEQVLQAVSNECGWMYETWHPNCDDPNRKKGRINYTVWSEILACPNCSHEITFLEVALDRETGHVREEFSCPNCGVEQKKGNLELLFETKYDPLTRETIKEPKRKPVFINYQYSKKKFEKKPDEFDIDVQRRIEALPIPPEVPQLKLPDMQMVRVGRMKTTGVTHIRNFFLPRQAQSLASLWRNADRETNKRLRNFLFFFAEQAIWTSSILNRYRPTGYSQVNQYLSGVFYVPSQISEVSPWYVMNGKLSRLVKAFQNRSYFPVSSIISTENLASLQIPGNSIDYIFTDPPFGENIYYSDLNMLVESWHKVRTAPEKETIVDRVRGKDFQDYEQGMLDCFTTYYRALKPGRWITIEFHNSQDSVWNAIQRAIQQAGFVIADVRTLDKQQGSFQQVTSTTAVKQDLVISAYKPNGKLEENFRLKSGTEESVWEFVRYHLGKLPSIDMRDSQLVVNSERRGYLLFDRMVAFHLQKGVMLPISAPQFYAGLEERFVPRDGMYFLPEQVAEYDRAKLEAHGVVQIPILIRDEKTAIAWLRNQLDPAVGGPQTSAELNPKFKQALHLAAHELAPEISDLLNQNFLPDSEGRWHIPNPNKAEDMENFRRRALLREFEHYIQGQGRLRQFRTEAMRAGFLDCLDRSDYKTLLKVANRLPEDVLRSDLDLLMYYDSAVLRSGE